MFAPIRTALQAASRIRSPPVLVLCPIECLHHDLQSHHTRTELLIGQRLIVFDQIDPADCGLKCHGGSVFRRQTDLRFDDRSNMRTAGRFGTGEFSDPLDPELGSGSVKPLRDIDVEKPYCL